MNSAEKYDLCLKINRLTKVSLYVTYIYAIIFIPFLASRLFIDPYPIDYWKTAFFIVIVENIISGVIRVRIGEHRLRLSKLRLLDKNRG